MTENENERKKLWQMALTNMRVKGGQWTSERVRKKDTINQGLKTW